MKYCGRDDKERNIKRKKKKRRILQREWLVEEEIRGEGGERNRLEKYLCVGGGGRDKEEGEEEKG